MHTVAIRVGHLQSKLHDLSLAAAALLMLEKSHKIYSITLGIDDDSSDLVQFYETPSNLIGK